MNELLSRVLKAGTVKAASILADSEFFNEQDLISTDLPILNIAFSGNLEGGLVSGLTCFAGESRSFKTLLGLYCMKAYLNKYPESCAVIYDSEGSCSGKYAKAMGVDPTRVIHVPVFHIEELKFDIVHRLEVIERGQKVFFMMDSLGNLASKKETDDAHESHSAVDMSRPKAIKSLTRIITPHMTMKNLPCIIINHVYKTIEQYSKDVVSGGTGIMLASNQVFIIRRSQEKDDKVLTGWNFTINVEKSRFVKEKSKLTFTVLYDKGIYKYSGIHDLAIEFGFIIQSGAWYQLVDLETGEVITKKIRSGDIEDAYFEALCKNTAFMKNVADKYQLVGDE